MHILITDKMGHVGPALTHRLRARCPDAVLQDIDGGRNTSDALFGGVDAVVHPENGRLTPGLGRA